FELETDGLLAIAIQHENDHLEGKLMIDKLGVLRRRLLHRSMLKRATYDARSKANAEREAEEAKR
ncbi:MAG: peptide deformylase, partial [Myxococcales bacterium]|nr:peptide deformylase [Myxococcales bacterium]